MRNEKVFCACTSGLCFHHGNVFDYVADLGIRTGGRDMSIAEIGDNQPPSAFDEISGKISDLYLESRGWLDGEEVTEPHIAEGIVTLMRDLQAKGKLAEDLRKTMKKPHFDAGKAVDAQFKPLSEQVKRAVDACKTALLPFEKEQQRAQKAEAEKLAAEAKANQEAAEQALRSGDKANIAATEATERQLEEAKIQTAVAKKAGRETGGTKIEGERRVGIRTDYVPHIEDRLEAIFHYVSIDPTAFDDILLQLARQDVKSGTRTLPGFTLEKKETVL